MTSDLLDDGRAGRKDWQEFRARFGSAIVLKWLIGDFARLRPNYVRELYLRLESAGIDFDSLDSLDSIEGDVPITGPDWPEDMSVTQWASYGELAALTDMLFPHGQRNVDLAESLRRSVVWALHGALETYAKALNVHQRGNVIDNIVKRLGQGINAPTADALRTMDATRHILVHNAAIVDKKYREQATRANLEVGEERRITAEELNIWSRAVLDSARLLHATTDPTAAV